MMRLLCPRCDIELVLDDLRYRCPNCGYSYPKILHDVKPDKQIWIGRNKVLDNIYFLINFSTGKCAFLTNSNKYRGTFDVCNLTIEVTLENETICKVSKGISPMIVGGMLFGVAGAVAGSIASSKKEKVIRNKIYTMTVSTDGLYFTGFQVETKNYNAIHDFVVTVANVKKLLSKENHSEPTSDSKNDKILSTDEAFDKLVKLKELLDKGIIDEKEYSEKRVEYLKHI